MPTWTNQGDPRPKGPHDLLKTLGAILIGSAVFLVGHYVLKIW